MAFVSKVLFGRLDRVGAFSHLHAAIPMDGLQQLHGFHAGSPQCTHSFNAFVLAEGMA
jgi:hypothetical protein